MELVGSIEDVRAAVAYVIEIARENVWKMSARERKEDE